MYINNRWYTETEVKAYVDKLIEENEKLKEMLEIAVEDIETALTQEKCLICGLDYCNDESVCEWRYKDEALKLIGEDGDTNA